MSPSILLSKGEKKSREKKKEELNVSMRTQYGRRRRK
jgi:hypothetical protein